MTRHLQTLALSAFVLASVVLGGASRAVFFAYFALHVLSIGFLAWGLYRLDWKELHSSERPLMRWGIVALLLVGLQLIPLPQSVWVSLAGRGELAEEIVKLDVAPVSGFLTLSFHESVRSMASFIAPFAVATVLLATRSKPKIAVSAAIVASTLLALLVGVLQFLDGQESRLYFYEFTNRGYMVGFFANANHMATLILMAIPFIAALLREGRDRFPRRNNEFTVLGLSFLAIYGIGVALVGSMTGFALLLPVTLASALIIWPMGRRNTFLVFIPILIVGLLTLFLFGDQLWLPGDGGLSSQAGRGKIFQTALPALMDFFPVGSGLGTFEEIYRRYEDESAVTRVFINHAHNDYLELVIELGLPGLLLIIAFGFWWLSCLKRLASSDASPFAWAAWIAVGVVLAHSVWDYPLRTAAISVLFSICCVLASAHLPKTKPPQKARRSASRSQKQRIQL